MPEEKVEVEGMGNTTEVVATPIEKVTTQEVPPVEPQTKTLTQAELDEIIRKARDEELQKYKGIQRTIAKREDEIATLKRKLSEPKESKSSLATNEIILADMKARQTETGEANPRIAQLEAMLADERRKESLAKQQQAVEDYTQTWRDKLEEKIVQSGFTPNDEKFDDIWESFDMHYTVDGKFEHVEKKLDRILKGVTKEVNTEKTTNQPVDEVEKKIQVRLQEEKRKWMKEHNILEVETGQPSASSRNIPTKREELVSYVDGLSSEDYKKIKPEIDKLIKEGKIK